MVEKDKKTILVVDDEPNIVDLLVFNLQKEGYDTLVATDGITAVDMALKEKPDLILLDVMIPKLDGISVCKKIRYALNIANMPILMVSAKDTESDKIVGLEMGADDYITKPFQIREVMARIKANLRKAELNTNMEMYQNSKQEDKNDIIKVGDLSLDLKKVEVKVKGEVINLTKKEFDVLRYLASQPGQVVTREMLLRDVWEYEEYVGAIRTIDVTMNRIRDKIEKDKANPKILITKRGVGYYVTDKS
ncbi:MAG: response regulator transcription factor [Clostridia bacterium]|nr:response regulator transcription factor [Clostridia bacterium]